MNIPDNPILVDKSALKLMAASLSRDMLKLAGASLITHGYLSGTTVDLAVGMVVAIVPILCGQIRTFWNHRKLVVASWFAPDEVAKVV
jgi:hypothetical protein